MISETASVSSGTVNTASVSADHSPVVDKVRDFTTVLSDNANGVEYV